MTGQSDDRRIRSRPARGLFPRLDNCAKVVALTLTLEAVPDTLWPRLTALLSPDESARAARFAFERDRRPFIAAHALKRLMLAAAAGVPPEALVFKTALGGKPFMAADSAPHFSLSHCDGLVACAVSQELEPGIDVEHLGREAPLSVMKQTFTPQERRWLAALPASERQAGFFAIWTLKEAFVKATGRGLAQDLQDITFGFDPLHAEFHDPALGDPRSWRFEQRRIGVRHLLALGWRGTETDVVIRELRLEALLEREATIPLELDALL